MIANRIVEKNRVATPTGNPNYLWGWGQKSLINNTLIYASSPVLSWSNNWKQVSSAKNFACGVKNNGTLWCWGTNTYGQLGLNDKVDRTSPVQVGSLTSWDAVYCGSYHTLARSVTKLYAWGNNNYGQLGLGNVVGYSSPVAVTGSWRNISAGWHHSLGIKNGGDRLYVWGQNNQGCLGTGNLTDFSSPVQVYGGGAWEKCVAGYLNSFAIKKTTNRLYSWGCNFLGVLGIYASPGGYRNKPYEVYGGYSWTDVTTAGFNAAGITTDGYVRAWGGNDYGQLGIGPSYYAQTRPFQVSYLTGCTSVIMVGGGLTYPTPYPPYYSKVATFALNNLSSGASKLYSWGWSYNGLGGRGTNTNANVPVQIGTERKWVKLSVSAPQQGVSTMLSRSMFALKTIST